MMMKRRTIGPAYERAPAEQIGEWTSRNLLVLLSAVVITAIWWWLTNFMVGRLLPFVASDGLDRTVPLLDPDSSGWIAFKIISAVLILVILVKTRTK
jgi:hypothetical protein